MKRRRESGKAMCSRKRPDMREQGYVKFVENSKPVSD